MTSHRCSFIIGLGYKGLDTFHSSDHFVNIILFLIIHVWMPLNMIEGSHWNLRLNCLHIKNMSLYSVINLVCDMIHQCHSNCAITIIVILKYSLEYRNHRTSKRFLQWPSIEGIFVIFPCGLEKKTLLQHMYSNGVGVTKAPSVDSPVSQICDLAKGPVRLFESHSYLTSYSTVCFLQKVW